MGKVGKDKTLNMRISETLKKRFEDALEIEGIDYTDFMTSRIIELCEKVEKQHPKEEKEKSG